MGCPLDYAYVLLAERFGQWPWSIEGEPGDRVWYYINVMGEEAKARLEVDGLSADEEVITFDDE